MTSSGLLLSPSGGSTAGAEGGGRDRCADTLAAGCTSTGAEIAPADRPPAGYAITAGIPARTEWAPSRGVKSSPSNYTPADREPNIEQLTAADRTEHHRQTVSEKWFHDLNSQNKFSPHRQNKIFKCVHKLFYFCEWQNNSWNTYSILALVGQFLRPQCLRRQNIAFSCASACADAIQTRLRRLKMLILYSQKFHRTKVPSSEKLGNGTLF